MEYDCTFFLRKATACHYTRFGSSGLDRGMKGALLAELHGYRRQEAAAQRRLSPHEHALEFLSWTKNFLDEDPTVIYDRGLPITSTIQQTISAKIRQTT